MEHIVYSEIWTDPTPDEDSYLLRIAIPVARIIPGSIPSDCKSFLVKLSGIGFVQFDYLSLIKGQIIYLATGSRPHDPDQLPLPSVILVAEDLLAARSSSSPHPRRK